MKKLKVYLDDVREPPKGYLVFRDAEGLTKFITNVLGGDLSGVQEFSLDHDLGNGKRSGADFLRWVLDGILAGRIKNARAAKWTVHSANPVGSENMKHLIGDILRASIQVEIEELARKLGLDDDFLVYLAIEWAKDLQREGSNIRTPASITDVYRSVKLSKMLRGYLKSLVENGVHEYATGEDLKTLLKDHRRETGKFSSGKGLVEFLNLFDGDVYDPYDAGDWRELYD
ncbi:MAG: hypothetical protein GXO39_05065 [Thermotogae bacterium]|nr:hypothetical protein [Thermotogota bacterium]